MNRVRVAVTIVSLLTLLAGCASSQPEDPTPTAAPTATVMPTISPGGTTVGSLLDQVNAALGTSTTLRSTFWTTDQEVGSEPPATGEVTIETSMPPDRRYVIRSVDGVVVEEQIAIGGRVFMRGQIVVAAIAPMMGTDSWIEVDPRAANSSAAIAAQVDWLLSPVQSPFASVSTETRSLEAFPAGSIEIGGRTCQLWTFGIEGGIEQELAIDADGLPCRLVQQAGTIANVTVYEINPPGAIITIPDVATPAAP